MDLNPVALLPSAWRPFIPKTDLNEQLKIYGDAEVTVSDWRERTAPVAAGEATEGAFWTVYLATLALTLSVTTNCPLNPAAATPSILNGVSTSNPTASSWRVTVMVFVEVDPSPAIIDSILKGTPVEPTIRYSSIFGWMSNAVDG